MLAPSKREVCRHRRQPPTEGETLDKGGFAKAFYDPNHYEVSCTLHPALERDGQRQLVEGRGRGRSGAHPARASREAIEETMLDLYAHLQALTAH